jgi:diguanylate cyclase (GGDEF)-like protein
MLVLWWSVFPLFGRKPPTLLLSLLALTAIGLLHWWDADPDLARLRNVVVVLCVLLSTFGRAWLAWRHSTRVDRVPARIMAALLVTNGVSAQGVILSALGLIALTPAAFALIGAILSVLVLVALLVVLQRRNTARLEHLADTDALTGALNRRAFYRKAQQAPAGTALMLFDFDLFKDINDRHGHLAGDRVLQSVLPALRAAAGPETTVARFGGEEFILLWPRPPAGPDAESLRQAVGSAATATLGSDVSVSAGVVELRPDAVEQSLAAADHALYQAKAAGRNCSVWKGADGNAATSAQQDRP